METTLRIRVLVDTEGDDNIFRDFEIPSYATFEDLHLTIQEQFEFDNSEMASFYESDDDWERGDEIMLMDMSMTDQDKVRLMRDVQLGDILTKPKQKMLYIFDFLLMWTFFVEVVSVGTIDKNEEYPKVLLSVGASPDQYSKSPEDLFGSMQSEMKNGNDEDFEDEEDDMDFDNNYPSY